MKKNNKGFSLIETLIVSAFVVSALIYLYTQITAVKTNYDITFNYNSVEALYGANIISDYLNENGYTTIINMISVNGSLYVDITNNTYIDSGSASYYDSLIEKLDIDMVLFTTEDTTPIIEEFDKTESVLEDVIDMDLINFMDRINSDGASLYRIVVKYNDGAYATIQFS